MTCQPQVKAAVVTSQHATQHLKASNLRNFEQMALDNPLPSCDVHAVMPTLNDMPDGVLELILQHVVTLPPRTAVGWQQRTWRRHIPPRC